MATYLVRQSSDKQIVGIFWATTLYDLGLAIDECTAPFSCEYLKINNGGIFWPRFIDVCIPFKEFEYTEKYEKYLENNIIQLNKFCFSDLTYSDFYKHKGWKLFNTPLYEAKSD